MSLAISEGVLERIREYGRAAYPQECCGLLVGRAAGAAKTVVELRVAENSHDESKGNRYLISPRDLLEAEKEAGRLGLDVIGVYHSHPDHPARPSDFDRDHAFPWYSYIIVSVAQGNAGDLASWVLRDDRSAFDKEELVSLK